VATGANEFLPSVQFRLATLSLPSGFTARGLALGHGNPALELVAVTTTAQPRIEDLRQLWKARHAGRAAPVVVAAAYCGKVAVCGPLGEPPTIYFDLDAGGSMN